MHRKTPYFSNREVKLLKGTKILLSIKVSCVMNHSYRMTKNVPATSLFCCVNKAKELILFQQRLLHAVMS